MLHLGLMITPYQSFLSCPLGVKNILPLPVEPQNILVLVKMYFITINYLQKCQSPTSLTEKQKENYCCVFPNANSKLN